MIIKFTVPGVPKGKGRPRFARMGAGVRTYTPKETVEYENWVRLCWMEQSGKTIPPEIPIAVSIKAYFPVPSSSSKKKQAELLGQPHCKKPDSDNIVKITADSLQGYVFDDDKRIYKMTAEKRYSEEPRLEVEITTE